MNKSLCENYALQLQEAMKKWDWGGIKEICRICPMAIVSAYNMASSPLYLASKNQHHDILRYFCHVLSENGISVDDVSHTPLFTPSCKLAYCVRAISEKNKKILLEYGGEPPSVKEADVYVQREPPSVKEGDVYVQRDEIGKMVMRHRAEIAAKWGQCRNASATILLLRRRAPIFRCIGHDMTRLIAQEVWATKRHEKWEK